MSFRAIYKCDICRDDTAKEHVVGVCFTDLKHFKLRKPESTQGVHICLGCLDQIAQQSDSVLHAQGTRLAGDDGYDAAGHAARYP